jgi:glutamyl-tRNA reductase
MAASDIKDWLLSEKEFQSFVNHMYSHQEEDAIRHLFKVVSGLDSMVVGESEVLGSSKKFLQERFRK